MNKPTDQPDPLEQLTEALASQPIPEGPDHHVKQRLLDKLALAEAITPVPIWRNKTMRKIFSTAALVFVVVGIAVVLTPADDGGPGAAFAAMLQQVKEIRTATFTAVAKLEGVSDVTTRSALLEPSWMRQEIIMEGKLVGIHVMDEQSGKMLMLEPNNKKAMLVGTDGLLVGRRQESIIQSFKKLPEDIAIFEGEEKLEDVAAHKYVYDLSGMNYAVWISKKDNMPVKITMADHVDPEQATFHVTLTDFDWGAEVDESLFALDVPEDYELNEQTVDFSKGSQEQFISTLRLYARMNEGMFPDAWNALTPATLSKLMVLPEGTGEENQRYATEKMAVALGNEKLGGFSEDEQEAITFEFQQTVIQGSVFFAKIMESSDWHYQGKGVQLGDAKKIIAWWHLKESKLPGGGKDADAHVIYGDLRIETMPLGELPQQEGE